MSLLNDALRDLETRKTADRPAHPEAQAYGALARSSHDRNLLIWILPVLLLLGAGGVAYVLWPANDTVVPVNALVEADETSVLSLESVDRPMADMPVIQEAQPTVDAEPKRMIELSAEKHVPAKKSVSQEVKPIAQVSEVKPVGQPKQVAAPKVDTPSGNPSLPVAVNASPPKAEPSVKNPIVKPVPVKPSPVKPVAKSIEEVVDSPAAKKEPSVPKLVKQPMLTPAQIDQQAAERGRKRLASGEYEALQRELTLFLEQNPVNTESRLILVESLLMQQKYAQALDVVRAADIATDARLRQAMARVYLAQGEVGSAINALAKTLPDVTQDPHYHAVLAGLYQQQGRSQEAVMRYADLVEHHQDVADWWAGLAIALEQTGQYQGAQRAYQEALSLPGLHPELARYASERLSYY